MMNLVINIRQRYFALAALLITLFYVFFLWRFWQYGIEALGINVTFFWLLLIGFFLMASWNTLTSKTLLWLVPFMMMIVSLSIYTNPFTTWISVLIAPILFFIFTTHESHQNLRATLWSKFLPVTLIYSAFKYLGSIAPGVSFYKSIGQDIISEEKKSFGNVAKQVVLGLAILFILSVLVIIPLLSSADESFASMFYDFFEKLFKLFEFVSFAKLFNLILGFLLLMGGAYYWRRKINPVNIARREGVNVSTSRNSNSITVGIVLAGVLFLYLMFIFVQIKTIFINALPIDFENTESLVKTGFWQLFLLTILNILFYVGIYNKYTKNVQRILMAFTTSSLLLIASAGYKVFMYVKDYGLSYEKFFAFYTVLFCVMVFVWFISLFVRQGNERVNIICSLAFMALWMYAVFSIIPMERIMFTTNLKLTQRTDSHINFGDLKMLGPDMLSVVESNFDELIVEARKDNIQKNKNSDSWRSLEEGNYDQEEILKKRVDDWWLTWIKENRESIQYLDYTYTNSCEQLDDYYYDLCECGKFETDNYYKCKRFIKKKWYEKTFGELFYTPKIKI